MTAMQKLGLFLLVGVCAAVIIWLSLDTFLTDRYSAAFEPRYVTPTGFDPDAALLLKEDANSNSLFVSARGRPEIFKYDSATRQVSRVEGRDWSAVSAAETDCGNQLVPDDYAGSLYGHYFLNAKRSTDDRLIGVLSAYGPQAPAIPILPNLSGPGRIMGTRYLEIRNVLGQERIGKPIRINIHSDVLQPSLCWTPNSRYVVVHDRANSISIVDLQNR